MSFFITGSTFKDAGGGKLACCCPVACPSARPTITLTFTAPTICTGCIGNNTLGAIKSYNTFVATFPSSPRTLPNTGADVWSQFAGTWSYKSYTADNCAGSSASDSDNIRFVATCFNGLFRVTIGAGNLLLFSSGGFTMSLGVLKNNIYTTAADCGTTVSASTTVGGYGGDVTLT